MAAMDPTELFTLEERARMAEKQVKRLAEELGELRAGKLPKKIESPKLQDKISEHNKLKYQLEHLERSLQEEKSGPPPAKKAAPLNIPVDEKHGIDLLRATEELMERAIKAAFGEEHFTKALVMPSNPKAKKGGDYQCNAAMSLTKTLAKAGRKMRPQEVAAAIVAAVPDNNFIAAMDIAGPGFININMNPSILMREVTKLSKSGVLPPKAEKRRCVVDLSSPNIAKEMHVGHLRSTIIGDSIARILEFVGHDVLRINHIGDWGTQFGMLIAHLKDEFPNFATESPPINDLQAFYAASKDRFSKDEAFQDRAREEVVKLQSKDPDVIKAWQLICDVSRREYNRIYKRLDIVLEEKGESYYQDHMVTLVKSLEEKGLLVDDETSPGRKIMWTSANKAGDTNIPLIVVKSGGGFTYDTSDLACMRYRIEEEKGDWLIYVVDSGQGEHFKNVFAGIKDAGFWNPSKVRVDHVGFGVVLGEDKKRFRSRDGGTVLLRDLLDEGVARARESLVSREKSEVTGKELDETAEALAYGCIKYADLSHNRTNDYIFSYDQMLNDKGDTAVYLLYALCRVKAILRQEEIVKRGIDLEAEAKTHDLKLEHPAELKLALHIARFTEVANMVLDDLLPNRICAYLYDLSQHFTEFYSACYNIERNKKGEIVKIHIDRLLLTRATGMLMEQCLALLGIRPVEKM